MKVKEITSSSNAFFRLLESLKTSKGIKKEGLVLISGKKIVPEIFKKSFEIENMIFADNQAEVAQKFSVSRGVKLPSSLFKLLDECNTQYPLLVLKAPALKTYERPVKGLNVYLALSDPSNLGAALRSLKAFNADQVILLEESAHAFLPKVTKSASGMNLSLNIALGPPIAGLQLECPICLDLEGEPLEKFKWPETSCLVLGEEGKGLPKHLKETGHRIFIGMNPEVESLSAPIALSIACHQKVRPPF